MAGHEVPLAADSAQLRRLGRAPLLSPGQRVRNRQLLGGSSGEGSSPRITVRASRFLAEGPALGIEVSRASV